MTPARLAEIREHWNDALIGKGFHGIYFVRDLLTHVEELEADRRTMIDLLATAKCPECDGSGVGVRPVCCGRPGEECCGSPEPEQYQCDWCGRRSAFLPAMQSADGKAT